MRAGGEKLKTDPKHEERDERDQAEKNTFNIDYIDRITLLNIPIILLAVLFSAVLFSLNFQAGAGDRKTVQKTRSQPSETHRFEVMKLRGNLRKPKINYRFVRSSLKVDRIIKIPENFDDRIAADASQF
jgi:hypothetical protein